MRRAAKLLFILACGSCSSDFDPPNVVSSVRVFATKLDRPYAAPGDTVTLETLAFDGRANATRPLKLVWFPILCTNPANEAYYNCFSDLTTSVAGGAGTAIPRDTDLTDLLPSGPTYKVTLPSDIITGHKPPRSGENYGLAIVFQMACAGRVKFVSVDPDSLSSQNAPIGCFDESGARLGPDDYVIAFTRIYAFEKRVNQNPSAGQLVVDDQSAPFGFSISRCDEVKRENCPFAQIDTRAPDDAQEEREGEVDSEGKTRKEQVWVTYYTTGGRFDDDAKLLFDVETGRVPNSANKFRAPSQPGWYRLWAVVHDNRNGINWLEVPFEVR
jgi:hypothetical protein